MVTPGEAGDAAMRAFIREHSQTANQIQSFDHFLDTSLPYIIQENGTANVAHAHEPGAHSTFTMGAPMLLKPSIREQSGFVRSAMPDEFRMRGLTYSSSLNVDIVHREFRVDGSLRQTTLYKDFHLAQLPIMVGSNACHTVDDSFNRAHNGECAYDNLGYFIINGLEKTVIAQEKLRINYPFVFATRSGARSDIISETRSCHESKMRSTSTFYLHGTYCAERGALLDLRASVPFVEQKLELTRVLAMLGISSREEAMMHVKMSGRYSPSIEAALERTVAEFPEVITQDVSDTKYMAHIVCNELLPHVGIDNTPAVLRAKAVFIGGIVARMLSCATGEHPFDDRDAMKSKRLDSTGALVALLFRQLLRAFQKHFSARIMRTLQNNRRDNLMEGLNDKRITTGFRYAFATGSWGIQKIANNQAGIVQLITQLNTVSKISHGQRLGTPGCREGKVPEPRQLHRSTWGVVCAVETPEGSSCGLIKNMCVMTHVRVGYTTDFIWEALRFMRNFGQRLITNSEEESPCALYLNSTCAGRVEGDPAEFVHDLRGLRRRCILPFDVSISHRSTGHSDIDEVHLGFDRGALLRPVLVGARIGDFCRRVSAWQEHERVRHIPLFGTLVLDGLVEYIDKDEEAHCVVACRAEEYCPGLHTHAEIHPTVILGTCAAQIPFSDHNQAPRNCYQSAMGKQAIGVSSTCYHERMDSVGHILSYPQKPLVSTLSDRAMGTTDLPAGENVMIAIMSFSGFNQEDSVILSQAAVDNGLFRSTITRIYKDEVKVNSNQSEVFEDASTAGPAHCFSVRCGSYDKLDDDAVARVGALLHGGDIIIAKTVSSKRSQVPQPCKWDNSQSVRTSESGIVDRVAKTDKGDGFSVLIKVRTRENKIPIVGDKFSSRHGQKGITGMVATRDNLPFTAEGLQPDIIINPHAIPSRMTVGQLIETLVGKACCWRARCGDGTTFGGLRMEDVGNLLEEAGMDRNGEETMYNPHTGREMPARVFLGYAFYQRLKHLVTEKVHGRTRGPLQLLTRQPNEGRAKDGGLRIGEMERDCFVSHGASNTLKECLFEKSDPFTTVACITCGLLCEPFMQENEDHRAAASGNCLKAEGFCRMCRSVEHVRPLRMPYAFKLLIQELEAMHIFVRLRMKEVCPVGAGPLECDEAVVL